ncbi:MAG: hypothetical protein EOP50_19160 [Sphingobacteriales bacterium]|nr:MAG: hypothetical protein EOP50_19160 [Sphingobacteriales bacterium]
MPSEVDKRPASIRWRGWIKSPISGDYRFHADAPNMRILVARNVVAGTGAGASPSVHLAAGRFYPIEVSIGQVADQDTRIRLEWTAPHGARYVVPKALLHLPTEAIASPRV